MIRAVLWDNDGVLVDTEHLYFLATQQVLRSVGIDLTEELYIDLFLVQARGAWHLAEAQGITEDHVDRLRAERNALYLNFLKTRSTTIDGVEDVLKRLHDNYLMGIVTSSHREHFEAIHRNTGLMKFFAFTLTSEDYSRYKPDPEPYRLAVERSGLSAEECVAVEDSERGLASATGAGLRCVVIPRGLTRSGSFSGAHAIVKTIREIPTVLKNLQTEPNYLPK
jgi:HAD superfamily hydrolase (TIGR01509 family)